MKPTSIDPITHEEFRSAAAAITKRLGVVKRASPIKNLLEQVAALVTLAASAPPTPRQLTLEAAQHLLLLSTGNMYDVDPVRRTARLVARAIDDLRSAWAAATAAQSLQLQAAADDDASGRSKLSQAQAKWREARELLDAALAYASPPATRRAG